MARWFDRFRARNDQSQRRNHVSWLKSVVSGSIFNRSMLKGDTSLADIKTQIDTMRALARDSQINTALSYYATDATTVNTNNQIIWATSDKKHADVAKIINDVFRRYDINSYARDHILELATIGNLYIPTTMMYRDEGNPVSTERVVLDNNTIADWAYDIVPSTKIPPEDIVHIYKEGRPFGYIYKPEDDYVGASRIPEDGVIHFSLGGLLGEYTIDARIQPGGDMETYDIKFAQPLMDKAVQPTQTLTLLEDAMVLSSLVRIVKFINVDCGNTAEEEEIKSTLQEIKDSIEQQLSLNTNSGDVQSFVNPQSPNNLIYIPKVNGQDAISITDLNMSEANEADNKLLDYYQDKKLSVLGVPKEAMNFSSNEGLGGAGSVLSQRSALYANSLQRLETAYIAGWTQAFNMYFRNRGMSGMVDQFELHMNPIITTQSTIQFEKRDAAISQATQFIDMLKSLKVTDSASYLNGIKEILSEVFPQLGADASGWHVDVKDPEGGEGGGF